MATACRPVQARQISIRRPRKSRIVLPRSAPDSRYHSHDQVDPGIREQQRRHDVRIEHNRFLSRESIEFAYDIRPMLSL